MKVFVKGQGEVTLTQQNYVAAGGQASVYVRNGIAYKIYLDAKDAIPDAKLQALSAIKDDAVVKPDKVILDQHRNPIGYTMVAIPDNYSLCQLFTRAFRDRNNVTRDSIIDLAARLRAHISNIHAASILVVDLNELNILVSKSFDETFFIDVDSYQVPGYPATVIMPSVRDYSVKAADFSTLSDWFSYGVLTFQMFVGVHPYKGTHAPSAAIPKDQRMVHRMQHHISAFSPEVHLPACCYPLDVIPAHFKDWLHAVLQDGKRLPPPDPKSIPVVVVAPSRVQHPVAGPLLTSGDVIITEIMNLEGWSLVSYAESGSSTVALTSRNGVMRTLVNGRVMAEGPAPPAGSVCRAGFTGGMNQPVRLDLLYMQGVSLLEFTDIGNREHVLLPIAATELSKSGDRFYIRNGTRVLEIEFSEMPHKIVVSASHQVGDVMERASRLHDGVAIQSMLGATFVSLFPKSRHGYQVRVPDLDGYNITDAKFEGGVLMVVGAKAGRYDRLVFRFAGDYQSFDVRKVEDVSPAAVNFVTLDSGVCVCLDENDEIEAFSARKGATGMRVVKMIEGSGVLGADIRLLACEGQGWVRAQRQDLPDESQMTDTPAPVTPTRLHFFNLPTVEEALTMPGADGLWIIRRIEEVLASGEKYAYARLIQDMAERMGVTRPPGWDDDWVWPSKMSWLLHRTSQGPCGPIAPNMDWNALLFRYAARVKLIRQFSFAVPTPEAIAAIARFSPLVELGAGSGYWAHLLQRQSAECRPYDLKVGHDTDLALGPWDRMWTPVRKAGPRVLRRYPCHTLLLCWPSISTTMASEAVKHYRGPRIIHIGAPGLTGDDEFYGELEAAFTKVAEIPIPQWEGTDDMIEIWERRESPGKHGGGTNE